MYPSLILVGVILLTQVCKKYIMPKYGVNGIHVFTFLVSLVGLGIYQYMTVNVTFQHLVLEALSFLATAVAVYEVILSKIGMKSVTEQAAPKP